MAEQEVRSPVCRPGSKVGSGQPLSPGARTNPSRATGPRAENRYHPPQVRGSSGESRISDLAILVCGANLRSATIVLAAPRVCAARPVIGRLGETHDVEEVRRCVARNFDDRGCRDCRLRHVRRKWWWWRRWWCWWWWWWRRWWCWWWWWRRWWCWWWWWRRGPRRNAAGRVAVGDRAEPTGRACCPHAAPHAIALVAGGARDLSPARVAARPRAFLCPAPSGSDFVAGPLRGPTPRSRSLYLVTLPFSVTGRALTNWR
jgi:hypothetical protein